MSRRFGQLVVGVLLSVLLAAPLPAYVYSTHQSVWMPGAIPMQIKLGSSGLLQDGTNYSTSLQAAMQTWNASLGTVQFVPQIVAQSGTQVDGVNDVYFSNTIEGEAFGSGVLAVTLIYTAPSVFEIVEADIIFNTAWTWNSYRGNLQVPEDIRRVGLHELGHVLGLTHPDQNGQSVSAQMNSYATDLDWLTADDIAGAQSLYRAPGQTYAPGNDSFANAATISLAGGTVQVTGTNLYATKEPGEPDHDPGTGSGGASVWWKWIAPYNGEATVSTQGSKFDTLLGIYTGSTVSTLSLIGANDDLQSGVARYSSVAFAVTAGVTYFFAVDGWAAGSGPVVLNLSFVGVVPPSITSHPANRSVVDGGAAQFTGSANASPAPSYRWQQFSGGGWQNLGDGGVFSGTGTASLLINPTPLAMNGAQFRLVATNGVGSATSNPATLTVTAAPPVIDVQPQAVETLAGATVTFTVTARGTAPLTYQWFKDGEVIDGATAAALTMTKVESSRDTGSYRVQVSNSAGSATSALAALRIVAPPRFTRQPQSLALRVFMSGVFSAEIAPTGGTNTFQWRRNGVNVGAATTGLYVTADYPIWSAQASEAGEYTVVVSNLAGTVTSAPAQLAVIPAAVPASVAISGGTGALPGRPLVLSAYRRTEWGGVTFQWYRGGQPIAGATSDRYEVPSMTMADFGEYYVTATNSSGTGISRTIHVMPSRGTAFPEYRWIDAREANGVAYFLFANSPRIARYDLEAKRWLDNWTLPGAPQAFALAADAIYVAQGNVVTRYDADFSNPRVLYTTTGTIRALLVKGPHLLVISESSITRIFYSIMRDTGALVHRKDGYGSGLNTVLGYSAQYEQVYGVFSGNIVQIPYNAAGVVGELSSSPDQNDLPDCGLPLVIEGGSRVLDDSGVIYQGHNLAYSGSAGGYLHAILPETQGYFILRGGIVSRTNTEFCEMGRARFNRYATFLSRTGDILLGFSQPEGAGQSPGVDELPVSAIIDAPINAIMNPAGRAIGSAQISVNAAGIVSIYSKLDGQIYRWAANEARYLTSIPLEGRPDSLAWSEEENSYYYDHQGYQVRRGTINGSGMSRRWLHAAPLPVQGLQTAGRFLLIAAAGDSERHHSTIGREGELVSWKADRDESVQYEWCELARRMFFFGGSRVLRFEAIDWLGQISSVQRASYSTNEPTELPIRVKADGSRVLLGSGGIYSGGNLARLAQLPAAVTDGVWVGDRLYTIRDAAGGTEIQSWNSDDYSLARAVTAPGLAVRLLAVPGDRLLLITSQAGVLSFRYFSPETLAEINPSTFAGAPRILVQPQPLAVRRGAIAAVTVAAQGDGPLSYQWFKNELPITGATGASHVILSMQPEDTGQYAVTVTNGAGAVTSSQVSLSLLLPPQITSHPQSTVGGFSQTTTLSVLIAEEGPVTYQWMKYGVPIPNANSANLTFGWLRYEDAGNYTVAITGVGGTTTSEVAILAVRLLPIITKQPVSQGAIVGDAILFSVEAQSEGVMTYQWRKDGVDIPDAHEATLSIASFQAGHAGTYDVVVSNAAGPITSQAATLVLAVLPVITTHPASQTVNMGATVDLSVVATSNAPVSYRWIKNGVMTLFGSTSATLRLYTTQETADYAVVVSNAAGSVTSETARVTVLLPPTITEYPRSLTVLPGSSVSFAVMATSTTPMSYQWQRQAAGGGSWSNMMPGDGVAGATTSQLTLASVQFGNNGEEYRCLVTNQVGTAPTSPAKLTVAPAAFVKLATGRYGSLRVDALAQVYGTGRNTQGQLGLGHTSDVTTAQLVTLAGQVITDVAAGAEHTLFLTSTKEVWATGLNATGQLGDGTTASKSMPVKLTTNAIGIAAGNFHSVVLKADGTLWTVGGNDSGQLGNGTTTDTTTLAQVATGVVHAAAGIRQTLFLKSDGSLWAMGNLDGSESFVATPVQIASNVMTMAAGGYHNLFVKTDGTLWAMGYNPYGQLGTGDVVTRATPVQVTSGVKAVAAGYFHSVFIKENNDLMAMGYNSGGQLGSGTTSNYSTPIKTAGNATMVAAGESYTLFGQQDGSLSGTGYNAYGQFGNGGTTVTVVTAQITAGVLLAPEVPTGLTVTQAVDRVRLTWQPQGTAAAFEVWRHTANDPAGATRVASAQRWAIYEDLALTPGQGYYYWVKAVNNAGTSGLSAVATTVSVQSQTITFNALPDVAYTTAPISLSATSSSSLTVTFSVVAGPASVAGNSLTLTGPGLVTVRASQAGDATYVAAVPVERSFTVTANFDSWALANFTALERADANVSGPNAIYGQDGLPNLVKYALGLAPKVNATSGVPVVTTTATDWVYTYTKPVDVTDVSYAVEVSTALGSWTTAGVTLHLVSTSASVETWEATYPLSSATTVFFRLRVTQ